MNIADRPRLYAEAFRVLRSQINMKLYGVDAPRRALAVISANDGDGKTFFAANLAIAFSQLGGRTLLVDADMRKSSIPRWLGLGDSAKGLSTVLSRDGELNGSLVSLQVPRLAVLPVVSAGSSEEVAGALVTRAAGIGLHLQRGRRHHG